MKRVYLLNTVNNLITNLNTNGIRACMCPCGGGGGGGGGGCVCVHVFECKCVVRCIDMCRHCRTCGISKSQRHIE